MTDTAANPLPTLTVIIHTKNAASTVEAAIKSVAGFATEILVADQESSDGTDKLAKKLGARVVEFPDTGYVEPVRNKAFAAATSQWILILDADEEISSTLATAIQQTLRQPAGTVFAIPRKNMILGQWAKTGWWPDYQIRLFKKGSVNWPPELHAQPKVDSEVLQFPAEEQYAIIHHNYDNIDQFIDRAQRYSAIAATEIKSGKRAVAADPLTALGEEVFKRYYVDKGYEQNEYGLTLAVLQGMFEALTVSKSWENGKFRNQSTPSVSQIFDKLADDAFYWEATTRMETSSGLQKLVWRLRRKFRI